MKRTLATILLAATLFAQATDLTAVWTPSPDPAVSYNLYWSVGNGPFNLYGSTTNVTMVVTNLTPGVYQFYVTATNIWGESVPSNTVKTPAGKPGAVTIQITR